MTPSANTLWSTTLIGACLSLTLCLPSCGGEATPPAETDGDTATTVDMSTTVDAPDAAGPVHTAADFRKAGPYAVGVRTYTLTDAARSRSFAVEAVYPIDPANAGSGALSLASFCTSTADQKTYQQLLDAAPKACPTHTTDVVRDAAPAAGTFPVIVFSHCHNCTRFSSLALLRRLASHGFVVLAPDHAGNTLFDELAGQGVALGKAFLTVRVGDLKAALDQPPIALAGHLDLSRVGALGHSFGSVTAGLFTQEDKRVSAVVGVAAPMQNPLLPGVDMKKLTLPLMLLLAREDNSITVVGNQFIQNNFAAALGPAWKLEVDDAGHWSFSDIAGLHSFFDPGCGKAERMTDGTPFTYLPVADAQHIAASWISAFFAAHLNKDAGAIDFLAAPPADSRAHIARKP